MWDTHAAELQKATVLFPRVGLRDVEQQVAVLLNPKVSADIAIAERHRAGGVVARRGPHDVVAAHGIRLRACRGGGRRERGY